MVRRCLICGMLLIPVDDDPRECPRCGSDMPEDKEAEIEMRREENGQKA